MHRRPPDKSVLEEVRRLRASLDPQRFQPLSHGLGLGRLKPATPKVPEDTRSQTSNPIPPAGPQAPMPSSAFEVPPHSPPVPLTTDGLVQVPSQSLQMTKPSRAKGWFFVYSLDLAIVAATLLTGTLAIELLTGSEIIPLDLKSWQASLPAIIIKELGAARSAIGFLILFLVYWLFFRIVAGSTLGEFFVKVRSAQVRPRSQR